MSSLAIQLAAGDRVVSFGLSSGGWVLLLGWPAIAGAFLAFSIAVIRKSRPAALTGCLLAAPMFLYLSLAPGFAWPAVVAMALLVALAWRVERANRWVSVLFALPAAALVGRLALAVLGQ